uniref:Ubiquitin thioesterase OTU n=1 Tax=Davidia involucrata TaxID=16924 RepID=A0A5B6ZLY5_DAVIN
MLGVLCARPKPWILASLSYFHGSAAHHRLSCTQSRLVGCNGGDQPRRHHSSACRLGVSRGVVGGAASVWHVILPSGGSRPEDLRPGFHHEQKGEGSWNVAWDTRPARWLHRPDSAWLLFGVCACLAAPPDFPDVNTEGASADDKTSACTTDVISSDENDKSSVNYRVTGVPADGRCLFRAITHVACLRNGEEAPDENRQRELADKLRAQVVDELLKRREETEWFIEGDFDTYVKRIQQPYVWGGEPELLMASHVLKTPISVFMRDRSSGLVNIANYGEGYQKDKESPIKVLFHGYGHYDILETISDQSYQKVEA